MFEKIKTFVCGFLGIVWVSCMCTFMAGPGDLGGAELNGFFAFLIWLVLMIVVVKKHAIVAGVLSTVLLFGLRVHSFGIGDTSKISYVLTMVLGTPLMYFILWKLLFPKNPERKKLTSQVCQKSNNMSYDYEKNYDYEESYDSRNSYDNYEDTSLRNGSDEYWDYWNEAEQIYNAFCDARTTDERRYYKKVGDNLRYQLFARYGRDDKSVKSICERFLDLRV